MGIDLIYFSQPDCGVCHALKAKVFDLIERRFPHIKCQEVDITKEPKFGAKYMVFSSPVIVILNQGDEVYRKAGNFALYQFEQEVDRLIKLMM